MSYINGSLANSQNYVELDNDIYEISNKENLIPSIGDKVEIIIKPYNKNKTVIGYARKWNSWSNVKNCKKKIILYKKLTTLYIK